MLEMSSSIADEFNNVISGDFRARQLEHWSSLLDGSLRWTIETSWYYRPTLVNCKFPMLCWFLVALDFHAGKWVPEGGDVDGFRI